MTNPSDGEPISPESPGGRLTFAELQRAVWAADPAAFLVLPRILRRVIKQDRRLTGFGLLAPHRKSYLIGRDPLLEIVEKAELGVAEDFALPEKVVLLAMPNPRELADATADELLIRCWRLLFHARVHLALEKSLAAGKLTLAMVRERIHEIGGAEFDEIRMVLGQEDLLLPPHSDQSTYVEFAATYLELRWFTAGFLPRYFPGLENLAVVDALLRRDVDAEGLFLATRPTAAPDPQDPYELDEWADLATAPELLAADIIPTVEAPSETKCRAKPRRASPPAKRRCRALMRKSQRPESLGNVVRAAIYHARAGQCAPPELADHVRDAINCDVDCLAGRLQAALEIDDPNADAPPLQWGGVQEPLFALIGQTPRGLWTTEARLLYDLQQACVDHERDVYTVDLVEWALSRGRRPVKRRLPNQRDVLMLKHLRSAARRLTAARISDNLRRQLAALLRQAAGRVEARLRRQLRPIVAAALDAVGLGPQNLPERVARKKLVEELLDQIVDRGFLTMGDLRDAISRNKLKLPDLASPLDFLGGDQLLRADRELAQTLDGVYRRGEFYLRWMQRLSSLGFGTRVGRFLTRFAVVPFGGSYVALAGVHHVWELIAGAKRPPTEAAGFHPLSPSVLLLGLFLLCLVNSAAFRRAVGRFFQVSFHVLRAVTIEPIRWAIRSPLLQGIIHSRPFVICFRFLVKPLLWTGAVWWCLRLDENNRQTSVGTAASIFLAINLLLNSRLGRNLEEVAADWIVQGWRRFGLRVIAGLFWLVVDAFRAILETVERLMYAVDEWLRFRSGEGKLSLAAKAGLGLLWFFVAYVLRFAVSVLIEPQINPIKHFPVVTVSHKLLLPLYKPFAGLLEAQMGMGEFMAWAVAFGTIWGVPGVFGFLVWELKENWQLYAANRRQNLFPIRLGPHGETMARFLKPGFHSGTLPKRYAKLRRAQRRARASGNWWAVHKHLRAIHHVELAIRRCTEREFLELLAQSQRWQAPPPTLDEVRLGTNCVRLTLGCSGIMDRPLRIALDVQSGWLLAGVTDPGWIERLPPRPRQSLATALVGLYKSMGVDLVRQQIENEFPPPVPWYDVSAEGLVVWPDQQWEAEVLYDLHEGPWIAPQAVRGLARRRLPTIERRRLLFGEVPVSWDSWVAAWDEDSAGQGHPRDSLAPICVLPEV